MKKNLAMALAASAVMGLAGCASAPKVGEKAAVARPEWVNKGSGAFTGDNTSVVLFGVQAANPQPNVAMQRKMADERAREEVAAEIGESVTAMFKDMMSAHADYFKPDTAGSEDAADYVSKSIVDETLVGCRIVDHWEDPETGALYSLAKLDLDSNFVESYKKKLNELFSGKDKSTTAGVLAEEKMTKAVAELDKNVEDQRARLGQIVAAKPAGSGAPEAVSPSAK
jgi:hypothetical protein